MNSDRFLHVFLALLRRSQDPANKSSRTNLTVGGPRTDKQCSKLNEKWWRIAKLFLQFFRSLVFYKIHIFSAVLMSQQPVSQPVSFICVFVWFVRYEVDSKLGDDRMPGQKYSQ